MNYNPSRYTNTVRLLGFVSLMVALICLAGTYFSANEILTAFLLGAFFAGLIVAIMLFVFAKVTFAIEEMRIHIDKLFENRDKSGDHKETV